MVSCVDSCDSCVVSLCRPEAIEDLKAKLIPAYDSAFDRVPEVFETHAADGAKLVG